jgi:hypothetical protein
MENIVADALGVLGVLDIDAKESIIDEAVQKLPFVAREMVADRDEWLEDCRRAVEELHKIRETIGCDQSEDLLGMVQQTCRERDLTAEDRDNCIASLNDIRTALEAGPDEDLVRLANRTVGALSILNEENAAINQEVMRLRKLLSDAGLPVQFVAEECVTRDMALLDLAIDVIAGRITGIDAERLAALR